MKFIIAKKEIIEKHKFELKTHMVLLFLLVVSFFLNWIYISKELLYIGLCIEIILFIYYFIETIKTKNMSLVFDKGSFFYNNFIKDKKLKEIKLKLITEVYLTRDLIQTCLILKITYKIEKRTLLDKILDRYTKKVVISIHKSEEDFIIPTLINLGVDGNLILDRRPELVE